MGYVFCAFLKGARMVGWLCVVIFIILREREREMERLLSKIR